MKRSPTPAGVVAWWQHADYARALREYEANLQARRAAAVDNALARARGETPEPLPPPPKKPKPPQPRKPREKRPRTHYTDGRKRPPQEYKSPYRQVKGVRREWSLPACPCEGENDDPGEHIANCRWADPNYNPEQEGRDG